MCGWKRKRRARGQRKRRPRKGRRFSLAAWNPAGGWSCRLGRPLGRTIKRNSLAIQGRRKDLRPPARHPPCTRTRKPAGGPSAQQEADMNMDIAAQRPRSEELVPSRYALKVGDIDVLVVSDGVLPLPGAALAPK